jgi:hypothetical protein
MALHRPIECIGLLDKCGIVITINRRASRLSSDLVIDGFSQLLLTAEVFFSGLNGDVPQQ